MKVKIRTLLCPNRTAYLKSGLWTPTFMVFVVGSYLVLFSAGPMEASFVRGDGSGLSDWHWMGARMEGRVPGEQLNSMWLTGPCFSPSSFPQHRAKFWIEKVASFRTLISAQLGSHIKKENWIVLNILVGSSPKVSNRILFHCLVWKVRYINEFIFDAASSAEILMILGFGSHSGVQSMEAKGQTNVHYNLDCSLGNVWGSSIGWVPWNNWMGPEMNQCRERKDLG